MCRGLLRCVKIVASAIEVSIELRGISAGHLNAEAMPGTETVAGGERAQFELVHFAFLQDTANCPLLGQSRSLPNRSHSADPSWLARRVAAPANSTASGVLTYEAFGLSLVTSPTAGTSDWSRFDCELADSLFVLAL